MGGDGGEEVVKVSGEARGARALELVNHARAHRVDDRVAQRTLVRPDVLVEELERDDEEAGLAALLRAQDACAGVRA